MNKPDLEDILHQYNAIRWGANMVSVDDICKALEEVVAYARRLEGTLNSPELHNFAKAVTLEAAHQRERWGTEHDAGKEPEDWFWVVGYLAGKALRAHNTGDTEKALHHTISTAAVLNNWHAAISGMSNTMRPGIDAPVV